MSAATRFVPRAPESPLEGVSALAWRRFVKALEVQAQDAISESGGLGAYDMRPRRLVELKRAVNLRARRTEQGRQVWECDFVLPWTQKRFLADPVAQYAVLVRSVREHADALKSGAIKLPDGVSLAGALAILHVGGRGALAGWPELFDSTRARFDAAKGAF